MEPNIFNFDLGDCVRFIYWSKYRMKVTTKSSMKRPIYCLNILMRKNNLTSNMSSRDKIDKINKIPILNDTHKQSPFPLHQLSIEILRIRQELPYKLNLLRLIHLNIILFKHPRQNQPTLQSRQMLSNAIPLATAKRRELEGMW